MLAKMGVRCGIFPGPVNYKISGKTRYLGAGGKINLALFGIFPSACSGESD